MDIYAVPESTTTLNVIDVPEGSLPEGFVWVEPAGIPGAVSYLVGPSAPRAEV